MARATLTARSAAAPPLNTVFTQPSECTSMFTSASASTFSRGSQFKTWSYYESDTADGQFSSCNPPGWDVNNFTFSPAVCPSRWIYYDATWKSAGRNPRTYSQAYCCAR